MIEAPAVYVLAVHVHAAGTPHHRRDARRKVAQAAAAAVDPEVLHQDHAEEALAEKVFHLAKVPEARHGAPREVADDVTQSVGNRLLCGRLRIFRADERHYGVHSPRDAPACARGALPHLTWKKRSRFGRLPGRLLTRLQLSMAEWNVGFRELRTLNVQIERHRRHMYRSLAELLFVQD